MLSGPIRIPLCELELRNVRRMRQFSAVGVVENHDEEQVWVMIKTKL